MAEWEDKVSILDNILKQPKAIYFQIFLLSKINKIPLGYDTISWVLATCVTNLAAMKKKKKQKYAGKYL